MPRLRSRLRPYGAVMDSRLEAGCAVGDEEEVCRDGCCQGCCQGPGSAIRSTRLLLKTLLFVSSVVVFVGSFKEGEGPGSP